MRLGRKNLLVNAWKKKKKKVVRKRNSKYQKERDKEPKKKKSNSLKEPRPTRQDTQAHGEVPQLEDSAQLVVTSAQDPLYAKRKMLLLLIEKAPMLV